MHEDSAVCLKDVDNAAVCRVGMTRVIASTDVSIIGNLGVLTDGGRHTSEDRGSSQGLARLTQIKN